MFFTTSRTPDVGVEWNSGLEFNKLHKRVEPLLGNPAIRFSFLIFLFLIITKYSKL